MAHRGLSERSMAEVRRSSNQVHKLVHELRFSLVRQGLYVRQRVAGQSRFGMGMLALSRRLETDRMRLPL